MKKILTGLTATNRLTLGNYIGAILPLKKLSNADAQIYLFVADYHAISQNTEAKSLKGNINNLLKTFIASGFDMNKTKIYIQSEILGHADLAFLLTGLTYIGELNRMTQFKDKSQKQSNGTTSIPSSLLYYPILMAADILLYKANDVVVGQDQKQHLELARNIAERFNNKYGDVFPLPNPIIGEDSGKIMSLKDPTSKMSKSDKNVDATIFLDDNEDIIRHKISKAVTDSDDKVFLDLKNKPGIYNLIKIYANLKNISINDAEQQLKNLNYKDFKNVVADTIVEVLKPLQERYNLIDNVEVDTIINKNRNEIQQEAFANLNEIKMKMGF